MAHIDDDSLDMGPKTLGQGISRAIKELAWNKAIATFAGAMFALFSPIYLYQEGIELWAIVAAFTLAYAVRAVCMPWIGMVVARVGFERAIGVSGLFVLAYYILMALVPAFPWFTWPAMIVFQGYLGFYWTGFHGNLGRYGDRHARGKEYSLISLLTLAAAACGPLVGGWIIELTSFFWLLCVIGVLQIVSVLPLFTTREVVCVERMKFWDSVRLLRRARLRRFAIGLFGWGEEVVLITIWPIYVFLLLGDYVSFGAMSTVVTIVTGFMMWLVGKGVDTYKKRKSDAHATQNAREVQSTQAQNIVHGTQDVSGLQIARTRYALDQDQEQNDTHHAPPWFQRVGSVLVVGLWSLRSIASSALQVFALDAGAKSAKSMVDISYIARAYDMANERDRLAFVVLWQQALSVGKVLAGGAAVAILLMTGGSLQAAFIPAAVFSLFLLLL